MLPILRSDNENSKKYVVSFQGLNLGEAYQEGEFSACENLSSALAPCLSQRYARVKEAEYSAPSTLHAKEGLLVVDGTRVLYKGEKVGQVTAGKKQTATVGNYVVIFPDKVYYNVVTGTFGSLEETYTAAGLTFAESTITTTGEDFPFKKGDAITISGCSTEENNKTIIVRDVSEKTLTFYENSFTAAEEAVEVTLKREVPDLEFICESNYRLWGTKGNTIYGSAYGDPFNFQIFDGLTGDSYYIDVATDGAFTGCVPYSSHICFFKEHSLHKLYGSKPSNFQVVTSQVYGVQAGCERSICIINETVYYKGINGVYAYSGGVPELVSESFGPVRFSDACAASDGERYYIGMVTGEAWGLYVYDVLRDIWVMEDDTHCVDMAFSGGYVYLLDADGGLYKIDPAGDQGEITWSATLCPFHETINDRKVYSKFHLRLDLSEGAWLQVEVRRDNDTKWQQVYAGHNRRARTVTIPVMPARCDSVEIRVSGKGKCLLRTLVREFSTGSDV